MANINDAFPSNYLKASDLKGAQVVVTVDRVEFEPVGREREMKPILYFVGKEKGLVLNKTNAKNIINLAGSAETDDWNGLSVCIYPTHVEFSGETVEAIRVKSAPAQRQRQAPPPPADPPPPLTEDDIPF